MIEMCKAFTGSRQPSYGDHTECFEIEEFRQPVMNAVANRIMDRPDTTLGISSSEKQIFEIEPSL